MKIALLTILLFSFQGVAGTMSNRQPPVQEVPPCYGIARDLAIPTTEAEPLSTTPRTGQCSLPSIQEILPIHRRTTANQMFSRHAEDSQAVFSCMGSPHTYPMLPPDLTAQTPMEVCQTLPQERKKAKARRKMPRNQEVCPNMEDNIAVPHSIVDVPMDSQDSSLDQLQTPTHTALSQGTETASLYSMRGLFAPPQTTESLFIMNSPEYSKRQSEPKEPRSSLCPHIRALLMSERPQGLRRKMPLFPINKPVFIPNKRTELTTLITQECQRILTPTSTDIKESTLTTSKAERLGIAANSKLKPVDMRASSWKVSPPGSPTSRKKATLARSSAAQLDTAESLWRLPYQIKANSSSSLWEEPLDTATSSKAELDTNSREVPLNTTTSSLAQLDITSSPLDISAIVLEKLKQVSDKVQKMVSESSVMEESEVSCSPVSTCTNSEDYQEACRTPPEDMETRPTTPRPIVPLYSVNRSLSLNPHQLHYLSRSKIQNPKQVRMDFPKKESRPSKSVDPVPYLLPPQEKPEKPE